MNFMKKKQAEGLVKFLQPKIIKKHINAHQPIKSAKIIGSFRNNSQSVGTSNYTRNIHANNYATNS
jgi:hypothetical protein